MKIKPKIIYTVGPPRSGKSTFARWLLANPNQIEFDGPLGLIMLDEDYIRLALNGDRSVFNEENEETSRAAKHLMIRTLIRQGYAVVVSDTHTRPESRRPLLQIDPNALGVYLEYSREGCLRRAKISGRDDLISPIIRCCNNLGTYYSHIPSWIFANKDGDGFKLIDVIKNLKDSYGLCHHSELFLES